MWTVDLVKKLKIERRYVILYFCLLLVLPFSGCSSKDDKQKHESENSSVKEDSMVNNAEGDVESNLEDKKKVIDRAFAEFRSLTDAEERIESITALSEKHNDSVVTIVDKALDDKNTEVRLAAVELLVDSELTDPDVLSVVSRALTDRDAQIREAAVGALAFVNGHEVSKLLIQTLGDVNEDVRAATLEVVGEKEENTRLEVLRAGIVSPYEDVKEEVVSNLIDLSNHDAVDILILGLKDSNSEFHEEVNSALEVLISKEFGSYEEAKKWWEANKNRYDDELFEKDE